MKTDELIAMLARGGAEVAPHAVARRLALGLGLGALTSLLLMAGALGARHDLAELAHTPLFWLKFSFAMLLAACGTLSTARLSRPGAGPGHAPTAAAMVIAAVWCLALATLLGAAPTMRAGLIFGVTWKVCPFLIAMLAVPVFAGTLWATAGLAPTRPRLTGAMAGFTAGAVAAAVYALHCPELAPPFIAIWYLLGMLIPAGAGAVLGPRVLRW